MKSKFLRVMVIVMAVVMVATFAACSKEIIYYLDTTDGSTGAGAGIIIDNGQSGSSGGSGGTTVVEDTTGDGSTYSLSVSCAEEDYDMINEMLVAYKKKYKDNTYKFDLRKMGENIAASRVAEKPQEAPDVFSFASDHLGNLLNKQLLVQVPDTYTAQLDNQIETARQSSMSNGVYYAFPYSYENIILYYNTSMLSANDVSSVDKILNKSLAGVDYNLIINMGDSYYTTMFLYAAGVQLFGLKGDDPNDIDLANDNAVKACRYIASLSDQDKFGSFDEDAQYTALKNNNAAAVISGPHNITKFRDALGDNFGVTTLPAIRFLGESSDTSLVCFSGVKLYGVSRKTDRDTTTTAEALKLAAYLSNAQNQQKRLAERDFCPTDADLFEDASESGADTVEAVVAQANKSKLKPSMIEISKYWDLMGDFLLRVYKKTALQDSWLPELQSIEQQLSVRA